MVQSKSIGAGPLAAANAALSPPGVVQGTVSKVDAAAFLAKLMDLRGSIALARCLAAPSSGAVLPAPSAASDELRALVRARISYLTATIDRALVDPFQRRNKLHSRDELFALLEDTGALTLRSTRALTVAIEQTWTPVGELLSRLLGRLRFELGALREQIGPMLRAMGPRFARLELFDATLREATARSRQKYVDTLLPNLARTFARNGRAAILALPSPATADDLTPWFSPNGWFARDLERGRTLLLAVLEHERGTFDALAEATREGFAL